MIEKYSLRLVFLQIMLIS